MNLNQLQYFVALARVQHFGKAAESLGITQPSFSYAIAQLEEELGVMLFDRKGRPPALTEEEPLFLDYAERSLDSSLGKRSVGTIGILQRLERAMPKARIR